MGLGSGGCVYGVRAKVRFGLVFSGYYKCGNGTYSVLNVRILAVILGLIL